MFDRVINTSLLLSLVKSQLSVNTFFKKNIFRQELTCSKSTIKTIDKGVICSKLTIKTLEQSYLCCSGFFIIKFITYFTLSFSFFTTALSR